MDKYNNKYSEGEMLEITIRDSCGTKLDSFKCSKSDTKKYYQIISILKHKYGYGQQEKDLEWLR
jgi:hypothetical protein